MEDRRGEIVCGILHRSFFASGNARNRPNLFFMLKDVNRSSRCVVLAVLRAEWLGILRKYLTFK